MTAAPPRGPHGTGPGPFLSLAGDALKTVLREWNALLLLAILPAIGSFLLEIALVVTGLLDLFDPSAGRVPTGGETVTLLMIGCINLAFVTIFSVAWTRRLLRGPGADPGFGLRWGRRELGYFGRLLGMLLVMALGTFGVSLLLTLAGLAAIGTVGGVAIALFVYVRSMLILPAAAIDRPLPLGQALQATRGIAALWIVLGFFLVMLPFLPLFLFVAGILNVTGLSAAAPYASLFIQAAIGYAMQGAIVAMQALVYRHLIGGRAPAPVSI